MNGYWTPEHIGACCVGVACGLSAFTSRAARNPVAMVLFFIGMGAGVAGMILS